MSSMLVIPAIDIHDGKCVRLYQGDFAKVTEYSDDPVEVARHWNQLGAEMLHVVDLDGARAGRPVHLDIVRRIAVNTGLPMQLGGGLREPKHVESALEAGALAAAAAGLGTLVTLTGGLAQTGAHAAAKTLGSSCGTLGGMQLVQFHGLPSFTR